MNRKQLAVGMAALDSEAEPFQTALSRIGEKRDELVTKFGREGEEVVAWCESCGAPFFDSDDFVMGEDVTLCAAYGRDDDEARREDAVCFEQEMSA